jgi:hypothetical protein
MQWRDWLLALVILLRVVGDVLEYIAHRLS